MFLKLLKLNFNFKKESRNKIGQCPYPRRSPLLLFIFNLQELSRFVSSPKPTRSELKKTNALKSSKKTFRALVLGNGPSLNKLDFNKIKDEKLDIWVVNSFHQATCAEKLRITHYVLSDRAHFENEYRYLPILEFVRKQEGLILIFPHWVLFDFPEHPFLEFDHLIFDDRQLAAWTQNTSPTKPRGYIGLTLYKSLAFANFLEYKEILVLGIDNTEFMGYGSNVNNDFLYKGNHAFQDVRSGRDLSSTMIDGPPGAFIDVAHALGDLYKFKGNIINLDPNSLTTAFPKVISHGWILK